MRIRIAWFLVLAGIVVFLPTLARADGASYNFGGCPDGFVGPCTGSIGNSANYTSNGDTITVTAFSITGNGLFIKTGSGDEHGLGMTGESDHEIEPGEFVQVNVSNLIKAGLTSAVLTFGSVQPGEGYQICTTNTPGSDAGNCFTGHLDGQPVTVNFAGSKYIDVSASSGDVLLATGLVATPEPSNLMLLGIGFLALVGFTLKKAIA